MYSNLILLCDFDGVIITQNALRYVALKLIKKEFYRWQNIHTLRLIDFACIFEESDDQNRYKALIKAFRAYKKHIPSIWRRFVFFIIFQRSYKKYEKIYDYINTDLEDILEKLKERLIPMAIISNTKRKRLDFFSNKYCLSEYFSLIISRNDTSYKKPHPYPINLALNLIKTEFKFEKINKNGVYFIGDLPTDVECAKKAGVNSIALLSGHGTTKDLEKSNPTFLIRNFKDLLNLEPFKGFLAHTKNTYCIN